MQPWPATLVVEPVPAGPNVLSPGSLADLNPDLRPGDCRDRRQRLRTMIMESGLRKGFRVGPTVDPFTGKTEPPLLSRRRGPAGRG